MNTSSPQTDDNPYRLLDEKFLKERFTHVGLFILSYETLKSYIIDSAISFFSDETKLEDGKIVFTESDHYKNEIKRLSSNPIQANIQWLVNNDAITKHESLELLKLKDYRDSIVHNPTCIFEKNDIHFNKDAIKSLIKLHNKISNFWGRVNLEIVSDSPPDEGAYKSVRSSLSFLLEYMYSAMEEELNGDHPEEK